MLPPSLGYSYAIIAISRLSRDDWVLSNESAGKGVDERKEK